jgi:hypothetical protein
MESSLKPEKGVHKILISTPSGFGSEYINEDTGLFITQAWVQSNELNKRSTAGPAFRTAYIIAFRSPPDMQDYTPVGELICSYLCVLFGKRFDCHGIVEGFGEFHVPNLSAYYQLLSPDLPQNSIYPRSNLQIPLDLSEIHRIDGLFNANQDKFLQTFTAAAKFYWNALKNFEDDPEIAFLHLVTAGEILSNFNYPSPISREELIDENTKKLLAEIENISENGKRIVSGLKSRFFQIKKGFTRTICNLINNEFFTTTDGIQNVPWLHFKQDDFEKRIGAAYDLRSYYVHSGNQFGQIISKSVSDLQIGKINSGDTNLDKIINLSPTYFGLERVIRYCLLRFAHNNGVNIDLRLAGESYLSTNQKLMQENANENE